MLAILLIGIKFIFKIIIQQDCPCFNVSFDESEVIVTPTKAALFVLTKLLGKYMYFVYVLEMGEMIIFSAICCGIKQIQLCGSIYFMILDVQCRNTQIMGIIVR